MHLCHYTVGEKVFKNKFNALEESTKTKLPINFNLFEDAFDRANWSQEPKLSWDQLLDIRAQQIFSKNKTIILGFSGGTDSLTVYDVFIRNNIIPDYIHIRTKPKDIEQKLFYEKPLEFLEQERKKYKFEIIVTEENTQSLNEWYNSPEWIFRPNARIEFSNGLAESQTIEFNAAYKNSIDQDYVYVVGLEKPYCRYINGTFVSYQHDTAWGQIKDKRVEPFFISPDLPDLHIKQSYMLAKHMINLSFKEQKPLEWYIDLRNPDKGDYYTTATIGCGRFGDIANSCIQKKINKNSRLEFIDQNLQKINYFGRSSTIVNEGIKTREKFMSNYLEGIRMLTSNSLIKEHFKSLKNVYKFPEFLSKQYQLNINPNDYR